MNKLFTKIVGVALGASMAVGVGVSVASNQTKSVEPAHAAAEDTFSLASSIAANDEITFVGKYGSNYYSSAAQASNNRSGVAVTYSNSKITAVATTSIFKVEADADNDGYWNFKDTSTNKYLYNASSSSKSYLRSGDTVNADTYRWSVSISNGVATISSKSTTRPNVRFNYNNGSPLFNCYASGQSDVYIYKKDVARTLSSIAVTSSSHRTFSQYDDFVKETITATYTGGSTSDVTTLASFSGYDMSSTGTQTVYVSYTENNITKETSYSITVNAVAQHTITYDANGGSGTMNDSFNRVSENEFTAPAAKEFNEWNTSADGNGTSYQPGDTVDADTDLYAIWKDIRYSTGFESEEGFVATSTYNNDTPILSGPEGKQWSTYYGTPSTYSPLITDSQSLQMRKYSGTSGNPYTEMAFDVPYGHAIEFNAKCGTASGFGVEVFYSTDSGETYTSLGTTDVGTSVTAVTAAIQTTVSQARFRVEFTGDNPSSSHRGLSIDDVVVTTQAPSTDPSVTITSKDGSGKMSGVLGDIQEVTYTTEYAQGLTLNWVLVDSESIVDWEKPYVEFLTTGADATLTAQLLDSDDAVVASDTVTFHTLVPSLDVKVNGTSRANYTMYAEDSITITASFENDPSGVTLSWSTNDTDEDYSTFNSSTGLFVAKAEGNVKVRVDMMYKGNSIANDTLNVTIQALGVPTLVVSTGTGKTSYKYGEALDKTGWTATYTDGKGVETEVINELDFGSLDFIGTKSLTATYLGTTSNGVDITVTNNGATCETETILEGTGFLSGSMPTGWSQSGAGSDYAATHAPYRLKFDGNGDTVVASVNTSASVIYATLGVKMIGGASSSSFDVSAKDSNGDVVATGTLTIEGAQNDIVNPTATLSNNDGATVKTIEFVFKKGSNVGVGTGAISVNDSASFAPKQASAYARYFLEQTAGYCDATISSDVKTRLINEFNWMLPESIAAFKSATIVRGKGATYENELSEALSRYINMLEDKGYSDADFLNLGEEVTKKTSATSLQIVGNNNVILVTIIASMVSLTAIGGYFFIRRRKKQY